MLTAANVRSSVCVWHTKVSALNGVGSKIEKILKNHYIETIGDLLLHCPFKYQDRTHITPIQDLRNQEFVVLQGSVVSSQIIYGKKKRLEVKFSDKTGTISLVFFYYAESLKRKWSPGSCWRIFGQVSLFLNKFCIVHPEATPFSDKKIEFLEQTLTPIYPNISGISQLVLRKLLSQALEMFNKNQHNVIDHFYSAIKKYLPHLSREILPLHDAINFIHQPNLQVSVKDLDNRQNPAAGRLIFEELYAHYFALKQFKSQYSHFCAPKLFLKENQLEIFLSQFDFDLTKDQRESCQTILQDLNSKKPMLRLLQGDVGSGKTLVCAISALAGLNSGYQVGVMAPTEILAEQLASNFKQWFEPEYRVALVTGKLKTRERRNVQENVLLGLDNLIVGTHALFQEKWQFKKLGLIVIDEQHRFGVSQRLSLQAHGAASLQGEMPHQLVMTATPIPRTLAMSRYAHMDISCIKMLPEGRKEIQTFVVSNQKREEVTHKILAKISKKEQVYWVCTLIEESDSLNCQAAEATYKDLKEKLKEVHVALVHGRMPSDQKEQIMLDFKMGKIDLLVATTVIEVGVNVPNATLIVIENAERLGSAQLHQLRGRVGRSDLQSHCILLYQAPLSEIAKKRLNVIRQTTDGFKIAEEDLKIRGPGEFLGVKQTGVANYRIADLMKDQNWLDLIPQTHKKLAKLPSEQQQEIISRWVGSKEEFAKA